MAVEITSADYAYLILLKAEGRELSNNEMFETYGVRLLGAERKKLRDDEYILSEDQPRPYRLVLTSKGIEAVLRPLKIEQRRVPDGEKRADGERQLYWAAMLAQQKLLLGAPGKADRVQPLDLAGRVRAAYDELTDGAGTWVKLADLRVQLTDVSKAELDKALEEMLDSPDVQLEPEPFGHRIGPAERDAAVHIGGEDRHKLAIGVR